MLNTFYLELFVCSALGIVLHLTIFIHGEHDLEAAVIARAHMVVIAVAFFVKWQILGDHASNAVYECIALGLAYANSLIVSILVYRLFLSPWRKFPGPVLACVTKLYHFWCIRRADNYRFAERMHREYGDVVRTGM